MLAALLRRHRDLGDCEDAAQEALQAAATQWVRDGVPDNPRGWLVRVASRRLIDHQRAEQSRTARETALALAEPADGFVAPAADAERPPPDDPLLLFLLCCHPSLSRPSQVALTLRAVAGLSTGQVAAAFGVPEPTMAQRLSRARATLRSAGARFVLPAEAELPERVAAVLDVLHLVFNEGYTCSAGDALVDRTLTAEAIGLTRRLRAAVPDHDEVAGALALMLLTSARQSTRTGADGDLVPLADQDRTRWDADLIAEGVAILEQVLPRGHVGRFQLQAAIAAVHAEAPTWAATDWPQISTLYALLDQVAPAPAVTLNRAVAVAMTSGPEQGLAMVDALLTEPSTQRSHRAFAVRGHLRELAGDDTRAAEDYARAAALTASIPEQRYLNGRVRRLGLGSPA